MVNGGLLNPSSDSPKEAEYTMVNSQDDSDNLLEQEEEDTDCLVIRIDGGGGASPSSASSTNDTSSFVTAPESTQSSLFANTTAWYHQPIISDQAFTIKHLVLAEGPAAIRLAKFVAVTFAGIVGMYYVVRWFVRILAASDVCLV